MSAHSQFVYRFFFLGRKNAAFPNLQAQFLALWREKKVICNSVWTWKRQDHGKKRTKLNTVIAENVPFRSFKVLAVTISRMAKSPQNVQLLYPHSSSNSDLQWVKPGIPWISLSQSFFFVHQHILLSSPTGSLALLPSMIFTIVLCLVVLNIHEVN